MDLNQLLHRHQTALIGAAAAPTPLRRQACEDTARELGSRIRRRQHELGATFSLVGAAS